MRKNLMESYLPIFVLFSSTYFARIKVFPSYIVEILAIFGPISAHFRALMSSRISQHSNRYLSHS